MLAGGEQLLSSSTAVIATPSNEPQIIGTNLRGLAYNPPHRAMGLAPS